MIDKSKFVLFFSHSAGEFADEEWFYLVENIAIHEGKTHEQVELEIAGQLEERKGYGNHPFQTWGSIELLERINATQQEVAT